MHQEGFRDYPQICTEFNTEYLEIYDKFQGAGKEQECAPQLIPDSYKLTREEKNMKQLG